MVNLLLIDLRKVMISPSKHKSSRNFSRKSEGSAKLTPGKDWVGSCFETRFIIVSAINYCLIINPRKKYFLRKIVSNSKYLFLLTALSILLWYLITYMHVKISRRYFYSWVWLLFDRICPQLFCRNPPLETSPLSRTLNERRC